MARTSRRTRFARGALASLLVGLAAHVRAEDPAAENQVYAFEEGASVKTRDTATSEMRISVAGAEQAFTLEQQITTSRRIEKITDGRARVVQKIERIQANAKSPQGSESLDTSDSNSKGGAFTRGLAALAGLETAYDLSAKGEVSNVAGLDALAKAFEAAGAANPAEQVELFTNAIQQAYPRFPADPIAVGASWPQEIRSPVAGVGTMVMTMTYTYQGTNASGDAPGRHRFAFSIQATIEPAAPAAMAVDVKVEKGEGAVWIDARSGLVVGGSTELAMTIAIEVGEAAAKQTIVQTMKQTQKTEQVE